MSAEDDLRIARDLVAGYISSGISLRSVLSILRAAESVVMAEAAKELERAVAARDQAAAAVAALESVMAGLVTSQEALHAPAPAAAAPAVDEETMRQLVADVLTGPHALGRDGYLAKEISEIVGRGKVADVSAALGWLSRKGKAKTREGTKRWHAVAPPAPAAVAPTDAAAPGHPFSMGGIDLPLATVALPPCVHRWTEPGKQSLSNVCLRCSATYGDMLDELASMKEGSA